MTAIYYILLAVGAIGVLLVAIALVYVAITLFGMFVVKAFRRGW